MRPGWFRYRTHCQVKGASQSGKSKFVESCIEECIRERKGVTVIDGKGTLYKNVLDWLAYLRPPQKAWLLDLSGGEFVTPLTLFEPRGDVSAHVERMAEAILKSWGHDIDGMPTFEDTVKMVLTFCAELKEPIQHGYRLLERKETDLRAWAYAQMKDEAAKETLHEVIMASKSSREWKDVVKSTRSRLGRFVGSRGVRRFVGLPGLTDIKGIIDRQEILLVNISPSASLSPKSGKTFAALLLSELLATATENARSPVPHFAYLDEANRYLTDDAAALLDLALASGLRFTFIHHHDGQLKGEELRLSMQTNARIQVVFNGLPPEEMKKAAELHFLPEINVPKVLDTHVRTISLPYEVEYVTHTPAGEVTGTRFDPFVEFEEDDVYFTREEKVSMLAGEFILPDRTCLIRLPDRTFRHEVPHVESWGRLQNPEGTLKYVKTIHALSAHEADERLSESDARFEKRRQPDPDERRADAKPRARKARPPNLRAQG